MDANSDEKEAALMVKRPLLETTQQKGGFRTLPFIIANEAFERMANQGLSPNMIMYLMNDYHFDIVTGTNILNLWKAATNFLPVLGAFIADSFLGRYQMIGIGSIFSLVGVILLWSTTVIPEARPPFCVDSNSCKSATIPQIIFLCSCFGLMSVGAGGIRASSLAFGADQLEKRDNGSNANALESYFSWYYAFVSFAIVIAYTFVAYIQEHMGWQVGFGVPVVLTIVSALSFFLASPFYIMSKGKTTLLSGFARVIVASYKNRHFSSSSESTSIIAYHHNKGSTLIVPSEKLRFLNKACIIEDPQEYINNDEQISEQTTLCTTDEVEEFKALIKVIPMWLTGGIMSVNISQPSFPILQAASMDRHISSSFEIPAASFGMFTVISIVLWLAVYDRLILPLAARMFRRPVYLTSKQRMGIGIFLTFLSIVSTAVIECIRRNVAIKEGVSGDPKAVVNMSAMWLILPNCLMGFAEAFNAVGQTEFYYSEFPKSMSSVASTLQGLGMCVGGLLATLILNVVDHLSRSGGNTSWVSSNINEGHYDYYYCVLAGLCVVNFVYFLVCSRAYGPCEDS